jgi:hypothetical protein
MLEDDLARFAGLDEVHRLVVRLERQRCVITGVGSNAPERRKRDIWCHVSYMRRPTTP